MNRPTWQIGVSCDRIFYAPGELVVFIIRIINTSHVLAEISNISLLFDFGQIPLEGKPVLIAPGSEQIFYRLFRIPARVSGKRRFGMSYEMHHLRSNKWSLIGKYYFDNNHFVNVLPKRQINSTQYHLFVSRSIRGQDRPIGDFIAQRLIQWNFTTCTVGIERCVPRRYTSAAIRSEIKRADGVVAIATPRNFDQITETWRTLEWLHSEVGIAYGINKPLFIFRERNVRLEGLPDYLTYTR